MTALAVRGPAMRRTALILPLLADFVLPLAVYYGL
jgi:hypothetical protein